MNIVQITPGAGGMYCGNCFRDNALVAALQKAGHHALMVPLYLPLTLEEEDRSTGVPLFFSGINVYLEQRFSWFRKSPEWLHRWLASPWLLSKVAGRAGSTHPRELGELTLSMLRGESGHQARELEELVAWLEQHSKPDVVCLSNALLLGMAESINQHLGCPVVCMLQGEDSFLDALAEPHRSQTWEELVRRAAAVDLFVAPSRYFAAQMGPRLGVPEDRIQIVPNGINLEGYPKDARPAVDPRPPVLGYFARMCPEKGLDVLVEAFMVLCRRNAIPGLELHVGGGCGPGDLAFVESLKKRLRTEGWADRVRFHPNLDRAAKQAFLKSLTLFSVPAVYGEAFGLYLLEAMASGVPVVQPETAAFPELIEATGGGVLCQPKNPESLANAVEGLLQDMPRTRKMGETGRQSVMQDFSVEAMMSNMVAAYEKILDPRHANPQARG